jgi:hypothetical protein
MEEALPVYLGLALGYCRGPGSNPGRASMGFFTLYLRSASRIFCGGRYQPGSTKIFWLAEGTSQPVTISKKWKNPSSDLHRKRTWVQALPWISTCSLGLPASGTDLKSRKGLYSGPSPIQFVLRACPTGLVLATHQEADFEHRPGKFSTSLSIDLKVRKVHNL